MSDSPLDRVHRAVRSIAPPDVPFPGTLTTYGDETVLCMAIDDVDPALWRCDATEHLWAPIDVVRHHGGFDAVMPWCSQRLQHLLDARRGEPFHGGEAVTLTVSLLRGTREALHTWGDREAVCGTWWLGEGGRPLFVHGDGGEVRTSSAALLDQIAGTCPDAVVAAALARVREVLERPAPLPATDDVERALFQLSAPRAVMPASAHPAATLSQAVHGAVAARTAAVRSESWDAGSARVRGDWGGRWTTAAAAMSAAVRTRLSPRPRGATTEASHTVRRGAATPAPPSLRRKPLLLMGGLTVAVVGVLVASFMFDGDGSEAEDHAQVGAPSVSPGGSASATPAVGDSAGGDAAGAAPGAEETTVADGSDPVTIATKLLDEARACVSTGDACAGVVSDPDVLTRLPADGPVRLVDDYGGMVVMGVGEPAVFVVLEQRGDAWIIRDVPPPPGG